MVSKSRQKFNTYSLILCALFSALIVAGAFIKLPFYPVPVTMQMEIVLLSGLLLGAWRSTVSACVYMIAGLIGLPVFARGGGVSYVLQPTFGYILGFIIGAYITGKLSEKRVQATVKGYLLASFAGLMAVYAVGVVYFWLISQFYLGKNIGAWNLLLNCFLITLPKDIIFCTIGAFAAKRLKPEVSKYLK